MTNQHTPGPWAVGPALHADCRIYATSETHAIARTYGPELNDIGVCALTGPQNKTLRSARATACGEFANHGEFAEEAPQ